MEVATALIVLEPLFLGRSVLQNLPESSL